MKSTRIAILILLATQISYAEEWVKDENGLFRISFGPSHNYNDDFLIRHGRLTTSEWVYDEGKPRMFNLLETKPFKEFGEEATRRYAIGVTVRVKAEWTGICEVAEEADMFALMLSYTAKNGGLYEKKYALPLRSLPNYWCNSDNSAFSNTNGEYRHYGLPVIDYYHTGEIKNLKVSLFGVTRGTFLYVPTIQFLLGQSEGDVSGFYDRKDITILRSQ